MPSLYEIRNTVDVTDARPPGLTNTVQKCRHVADWLGGLLCPEPGNTFNCANWTIQSTLCGSQLIARIGQNQHNHI